MNITKKTTKKRDFEFYDLITLDTSDAIAFPFFFMMHIFFITPTKSPHLGNGSYLCIYASSSLVVMCTPTSMIMYYVLETGYGLFCFLTVVASNQADLRVRRINIGISFHH